MVWKVEWFKYEKLGTKGVPLGYLKFSRAFGGTECAPLPPILERVWVLSCDPVLFGLGRAELQPACFNFEAGVCIVGARAQLDPTRCAPRLFLETCGYPQRTEQFWANGQNSSDKNHSDSSCQNGCGSSVQTVATAPSNCRSGVAPLSILSNTQQSPTQKWKSKYE